MRDAWEFTTVERKCESSQILRVRFLGLNIHMPLEHSGSGARYASETSRGGKSEQNVETGNTQNLKARGPGAR